MPVDENLPKTTNRPSSRRRFKRGVTAVAIAGALLVPAAVVTIAAEPWADDVAIAASANSETEVKTAEEAEAELRECLDGMSPSDATGDIDIAFMVKAVRCLELVDGMTDPDSPLTEKEAQQLVKQGLQGVEAAGVAREQIPGVLSVLSDSGLVKPLAGERVADLITLMAESKVIEDYANREIDLNEASEGISEALVVVVEQSSKQSSK